jgi:hypothetical protein
MSLERHVQQMGLDIPLQHAEFVGRHHGLAFEEGRDVQVVID